jgi:hypothetical protein
MTMTPERKRRKRRNRALEFLSLCSRIRIAGANSNDAVAFVLNKCGSPAPRGQLIWTGFQVGVTQRWAEQQLSVEEVAAMNRAIKIARKARRGPLATAPEPVQPPPPRST